MKLLKSTTLHVLDVTSHQFHASLQHIDLVTILGGALNGVFDFECQKTAWSNIKNILHKDGHVICDVTLLDGFFEKDEIGTVFLNPEKLPPQYFLSEKQLFAIWDKNGFKIEAYEDLKVNRVMSLRYYLLRSIH